MSVIHTNNITNKDGTSGPTISGITTVSSTGFMKVPVGDTFRRQVLENVVDSGLVLYLDAGNDISYPGSGTTWRDLSGENNNGTFENQTTYSSSNGGSIVFDGVNDRVFCLDNDSLDLSTLFTISLWIKRVGDAPLQTEEVLLHKESGGIPYGGYILSVDRTTLLPSVRIRSSTNSTDTLIGTNSISSTNWNHIVCTYNSTTLQLYQNGNSNGSKTSSVTSIGNVITNLSIGGLAFNGYSWNGNIAQVSIYNRALSAAEVQQNFNALRSRYGI
jgi:hypothetical protein